MKLLLSLATGYLLGVRLSYAAGVAAGRVLADSEWALMLEHGMVGPGTTTNPATGADCRSLNLVGGA